MKNQLDSEGRLLDAEVIAGGRKELERQLMWAVALNGDPKRIAQLERLLAPEANDGMMVPAA
jgi:hypothetical protein